MYTCLSSLSLPKLIKKAAVTLYLGIVPSQLHCVPNQFDDDAVLDLTCNEDSAKKIITFEYLPTGNLRFATFLILFFVIQL